MPSQEVLTEYAKKVDFLKGLLEAEKLVCIHKHGLIVCRLALHAIVHSDSN